MAVKSFDMRKVIATVNAVPIRGFVDGDAITVEYEEDSWAKEVGSDGEVARVAQNRRDGKITFRLMASSASNRVLANFKRLDDATGLAPVKIVIRDLLLGDSVVVNAAWCTKDPGRTFGRELGEKEWVYDCAEIVFEHGGGSPF